MKFRFLSDLTRYVYRRPGWRNVRSGGLASLFLIAVVFVGGPATSESRVDAPLVYFLLPPFFSEASQQNVFEPLVSHLMSETGYAVRNQRFDSAEEFSRSIEERSDYLTIIAAQAALPLLESGRYAALAQTRPDIKVVLFTLTDGDVQSVADLGEGEIAVNAAASHTTASAARVLRGQGVWDADEDHFRIVGTHDGAIYEVLQGRAVAGVTLFSVLNRLSTSKQAEFRVIEDLGVVTHSLFVAGMGLPPEVREKVRGALISFYDERAPSSSSILHRDKPFEPFDESDLAELKAAGGE